MGNWKQSVLPFSIFAIYVGVLILNFQFSILNSSNARSRPFCRSSSIL